jgi:hypothetical protein
LIVSFDDDWGCIGMISIHFLHCFVFSSRIGIFVAFLDSLRVENMNYLHAHTRIGR